MSLVCCKFMALESECPHCDGNRCQGGEASAVALANCTKSLVLGESSHVTENRYKVKTYENVWNVKHRQTVWLQELWCPGQAKPVNSCHNSLSIYWIHGVLAQEWTFSTAHRSHVLLLTLSSCLLVLASKVCLLVLKKSDEDSEGR